MRSQAVIALGQIQANGAVTLPESIAENDPSKDVRHQATLSLDQIRKRMGATQEFRRTLLDLDASTFETVNTGDRAPDFTLRDTGDETWNLRKGDRPSIHDILQMIRSESFDCEHPKRLDHE